LGGGAVPGFTGRDGRRAARLALRGDQPALRDEPLRFGVLRAVDWTGAAARCRSARAMALERCMTE